MVLSRSINPEKVLKAAQEHADRTGHQNVHTLLERENPGHTETGNPRYDTTPIPKHSIPSVSTDPDITYELIHNHLALDANPLLNLASFVHTYMPPQADKLMAENVGKNLIDGAEYPAVQIIVERCVSMLAKLWHADEKLNATGAPTTGSSEAIQLGGLAMKRKWQERMRAAGKDEYRPGPNVVMGANAQVAIEKFARYFDVECRLVPVDASTNYCMDPKRAMDYVDENTIGIYVILGSTYTGHYENVQEMADLLDAYEAKTSIFVPIHVDAASGGFVAPFATPSLKWDFEIPRVVSINTSGHKWGKTYVGCGFVIWRDSAHLPKEMVFELHYLGSTEYSFSLNFSRPAAPIIGMYFNLVHLGFEGYRRIAIHDAKNARLLSRALEKSKYYDVVSSSHKLVKTSVVEKAAQAVGAKAPGLSNHIEDYVPGLPVVAFKFSQEFKKEYPHIKQSWIQTLLRSKEWVVPNYALPPNAEDVEILRVVIREQFTEDLVERLVIDLIEVTEGLMSEDGIVGFHKLGGKPTAAAVEGQRPRPRYDHENFNAERAAASHGEGTKATGHSGVC